MDSNGSSRAGTRVAVVAALAAGVGLGGCSSEGESAAEPGDPPPAAGEPTAKPSTPLAPPVSGGTLLVSRDGRTAVASDPDRDRVYVVDLTGRKVRATLALPAHAEPGRAVEDAEGRAHVVLRGAGMLLTLDLRDGRELARVEACPAPRGVAFDRAKDLLHVACAGGELVSLRPLAMAPARKLMLDRDLRDVIVSQDKLLVTTFRKSEVLVVGEAGVSARYLPARTQPAFLAGRVKRPAPPPGGTAATMDSPTASPGVAWRLIPGPDGQALVLHQRAVDGEIGTDPGSYGNGQSCAGIVEAAITQFDGRGSVLSGAALSGTVVPIDMALSADGRQLAVVAAGSAGTNRQLQFYPTAAPLAASTAEQPCVNGGGKPMPPTGDAPAPDDLPPPLEYREANGEVIAVAFDPAGNVIVQSRQPSTLQILTQRTPEIFLSTETRADRGHQIFHTATPGLVACASCHPEGGEDGRIWRFVGAGARRTQSLRGGIMDTAPFHWGAELRTLDHLMGDVFQRRMAGGSMDAGGVQSLGRWLDQIPSIPVSRWHDAEAVDRGRAIFRSAAVGCVTCHRGDDFTDGSSYDVGSGGKFQVPQLHSVAFRAPYMHDGCAATLAERFTKCGGDDRHGVTSKLDKTQIEDLIAYLESL